jgi:6-phosphofructokinase
VLATRFGVFAVEMILAGRLGRMAALKANTIVDIPLEDAIGSYKLLDPEIYRTAEALFG